MLRKWLFSPESEEEITRLPESVLFRAGTMRLLTPDLRSNCKESLSRPFEAGPALVPIASESRWPLRGSYMHCRLALIAYYRMRAVILGKTQGELVPNVPELSLAFLTRKEYLRTVDPQTKLTCLPQKPRSPLIVSSLMHRFGDYFSSNQRTFRRIATGTCLTCSTKCVRLKISIKRSSTRAIR